MRCFTVNHHGLSPWISFQRDPFPHVGIGEHGRGRKYTRFPVGRNFAESLGEEAERIERASVIKTRAKGTLMLVEPRTSGEIRALVHVSVPAGFRGTTEWTSGQSAIQNCPHRDDWYHYGKPVRWGSGADMYCSLCGERYVHEKHPDEGKTLAYLPFPKEGITILAEGLSAQGAAGRMGGHKSALLIMDPGANMRVLRTGRLYGSDPEVFIHWDGRELRTGAKDEVYPPSDEEEDGELV